MTMAPDNPTLAERLKAKRDRDGLSLREAGEASGIAFSTLARIESGSRPSLRIYQTLIAWIDGAELLLAQPPMALRDLFATHAPTPPSTWWGGRSVDCAGYALWNYQYADAMLAARAEPTP